MLRRVLRWRHRRARWERIQTERGARAFETACWYLLRDATARKALSIHRRREFTRLLEATGDIGVAAAGLLMSATVEALGDAA